ncbi:MAG TPA: cation-translocating P-type ATPase C-terminal domain-containing protein, partial [Thermodesulfobacteriota bacterium]
LAGNAGEILVMLLAALVGFPLPLLPVQILWVNLVTDGLPALALATERVEPEALTRPPRRLDDGFTDARFLRRLVLAGAAIGLVSLLGFWLGYRSSGDADEGRSLAFAVLVVSHVLWALAARSWTRIALGPALFTNARLLAVVVGTLVLQVLVESVPAVAAFLGVEALALGDWLLAGALGLVPAVAVDLSKWIERRASCRGAPRLRSGPIRGPGPGRRAAAPPEAGGTRPPSDRG